MQIGGYWDDQSLTYLKLDLGFCSRNETKSCKNFNEIVKKNALKDNKIYVSLIYPEIIFNAEDYRRPFVYRFKNYWALLASNFQYNDEFYIGYNHLSEDSGILFEVINDKKELGGFRIEPKMNFFDKEEMDDTSKLNSSNRFIYSLSIYFDKYYKYHVRKYMKLQDLLGNIKGFMDLIIFIFAILYKIYNKYRFNIYLYNRLVYIKENICQDNKRNHIYYQFNKDIKSLDKDSNISYSFNNKRFKKFKSDLDLNFKFRKVFENFNYKNNEMVSIMNPNKKTCTFRSYLNLNVDNILENTNKTNLNNLNQNIKDKLKLKISKYDYNNEKFFNFAENSLSSRKFLKSEFLKEQKLRSEEINTKFINGKNSIRNHRFIHNKSTNSLKYSIENINLNESEIKNILSRLKEKKNSVIFQIPYYLKYLCFSRNSIFHSSQKFSLYRQL